jgi:hypothetical protein
MILILFGAMLLPSLLTAEGLPHALRSIGTAVPVFILAGMGVNYLLYIWYKTFPINNLARATGLTLICLLLGLSLVQAYRQYFVAWAQDSRTYEAYNEGAVAIAKYLNANSKDGKNNFVLMGGYEANPIKYLTDKKSKYELLNEQQLKDLPIEGKLNEIIIVPTGINQNSQIEILKAKFPKGKITTVSSDFNGSPLFVVFEVQQ